MSDALLLLLLLVLLVCLLLTIGGFLFYSGLLADVDVKTGPPPIRNVTIAYKFKEGPYKDSGAAFTETCSIAPKLSTIALFYDDPKQRPPEKCRYAVGSVLCEGDQQPDQELQKMYEKFGFKVFSLPEVSHAVTATFPSAPPLSTVLGPLRVYPRLAAYIKERNLCAFPMMEICGPDIINYMAPLSRQSDFLVPEMVEETPTDVKEEDSDEDRGTDITGADSHSDLSSVSGGGGGGAPWDSRETSLAASTAASLASSLPLRDVVDAGGELQERSESVGSGSSFEELDMDQEEVEEQQQQQEEEKEEAGPPLDGGEAQLTGRPGEKEEEEEEKEE